MQQVARLTLTRKEAAASLGVSVNHFERRIQTELKAIARGLSVRPDGPKEGVLVAWASPRTASGCWWR